MDEKMKNKKGQVAIFVIVAIVIVASILLFFFLRKTPVGVGEATFNPEQYIKQCIEPSITKITDEILPHGGFQNPSNFKVYNHTNVEYLCKTDEDYTKCVDIHPMFISEISNEIKEYITPIADSCFESFESAMEKRGASVEMDNKREIVVLMTLGKVFVTINQNIKITEKENSETFEKVEFNVASPIYNLASVAIDIANEEERYCTFDDIAYMGHNRDVTINSFMMSDSTRIYTIKDKESGKIMNTAIRSCPL